MPGEEFRGSFSIPPTVCIIHYMNNRFPLPQKKNSTIYQGTIIFHIFITFIASTNKADKTNKNC